jgi:hypothetical protein
MGLRTPPQDSHLGLAGSTTGRAGYSIWSYRGEIEMQPTGKLDRSHSQLGKGKATLCQVDVLRQGVSFSVDIQPEPHC